MKKLFNVIVMVDTSAYMQSNEKAINEALLAMISVLHKAQTDNQSEAGLIVRISVMLFNETARFVVEPTPIFEYEHERIYSTCYAHNYRNAFELLNEKMSRNAYMAHTGKIAKPCIILITGGEPSETDDYNRALDALFENGWFKASDRYFVNIHDVNYIGMTNIIASKFTSNSQKNIVSIIEIEDIIRNNPVLYYRPMHIIDGCETLNSLDSYEIDLGDLSEFDDIMFTNNDFI